MMVTLAATLNPISKQAWSRLFIACSLSLLLHLALLLAIPVNPTGGAPNVASLIYARLEPATPEAAAASKPPAQEAMLTPPDKKTVPADEGFQQRLTETKPELKPEPERKPATVPPSSLSAGLELPLIRDVTYYPAKQLDVYPQPLTPIRLDYPNSAVAARIDGRLLVLLLIDEFGVVNEASVVEAEPAGYFEGAALAVFRATRFSPGQKQGHAVKSRVLLQVKYLYGDSVGAMR